MPHVHPCEYMTGTDIAFRAGSTMQVSPQDLAEMNMELLSYDRGITHVRMMENGMKVAIVPFGKGNRMVMHRLVVGGSRLENESTAGMAHVLEHADFRALTPGEGGKHTWSDMRAIDANAYTNKLGIGHTASMLINTDPADEYHLDMELAFQYDTMVGRNLLSISPTALAYEIRNVADEGLFNSQYGAQHRGLITQMEDDLLRHIWNSGRTGSTIGKNHGQDIRIRNATELLALHHQLRNPARTTMVLAGPIDPTKALRAVAAEFSGSGDSITQSEATAGLHTLRDMYTNPRTLKAIPTTRAVLEPHFSSSAISMEGGTRGMALGFAAPPYGADSEALQVIQQLVSMYGSQPALEANGLEDVSMYYVPDANGSVASVLATVSNADPDEDRALARAQQALEKLVIDPIKSFNDARMLSQVLQQYRAMTQEATLSNPEVTATLAARGIAAADMPSLGWHHDTLFSDARITVDTIRHVASNVFDGPVRGIVRNTEHAGSAPAAARPPHIASTRFSMNPMRPFSFHRTRAHTYPAPLQQGEVWAHAGPASTTVLSRPLFMGIDEGSSISRVTILDPRTRLAIAEAAYNGVIALPASKRQLTAVLGNVEDFGGWARASIAASALASIAKATNAHGVKFKIQGGQLKGTVSDSAARPKMRRFDLPLLNTLAMATALANGTRVRGLQQLAAQLPDAAMKDAAKEARKSYANLAYMAQAQMRSQVALPGENGYVPATFDDAIRSLYQAKDGALAGLSVVAAGIPTLAGTNLTYLQMDDIAQKMARVRSGAAPVSDLPRLYQSPARVPVSLVPTSEVPGLSTFPYVAAMRGTRALDLADRAALIVSNQLMVGGLGAAFSSKIRKNGISYRPSGGLRLSWSDTPMLTLNATFDPTDRAAGKLIAQNELREWSTGTSAAFSAERFATARTTVREQLRMRKLDFEALEYDLLAHLDPGKLGSDQFVEQLDALQLTDTTSALQRYFGGRGTIREAEVMGGG